MRDIQLIITVSVIATTLTKDIVGIHIPDQCRTRYRHVIYVEKKSGYLKLL